MHLRMTPATVGFWYGKFCNAGWRGYGGEEPCDDLDACCSDPDHCIKKKGSGSKFGNNKKNIRLIQQTKKLGRGSADLCLLEKIRKFRMKAKPARWKAKW